MLENPDVGPQTESVLTKPNEPAPQSVALRSPTEEVGLPILEHILIGLTLSYLISFSW